MQIPTSHRTIDLLVVMSANTFNLMMVAIFLLRTGGNQRLETIIGWIQIPLGIALTIATIYNFIHGRGLWMVLLPALMVAFILLELILDYVLKLNFRQTRILGPYLLLYYAAQMGLIGYAFLVDQICGFITLTTYFLSLGATGYSYYKVGHGRD